MPERFWVGTPPPACNLCEQSLTNRFYDARTVHGPWGSLCHTCFRKYGVGLGTGNGQEYRKQADGRFIKVAG